MIYRGGAERRAPEGPTDQPDGAIPGCTHTVTPHAALHGRAALMLSGSAQTADKERYPEFFLRRRRPSFHVPQRSTFPLSFPPCFLLHTRPFLPPRRRSARFSFCEGSTFHSFHAQGCRRWVAARLNLADGASSHGSAPCSAAHTDSPFTSCCRACLTSTSRTTSNFVSHCCCLPGVIAVHSFGLVQILFSLLCFSLFLQHEKIAFCD